jgi:hypothetical protein
MEIELKEGAKPVAKPAFRLSPAEKDEMKKQLGLLLEKRLLRPSVSPWGAPVLLAPEKGVGVRMCLEYRALNKLTVAPWVCFYCFQYFVVMMSLCRILRSYIGYTVFGDVGVFPS